MISLEIMLAMAVMVASGFAVMGFELWSRSYGHWCLVPYWRFAYGLSSSQYATKTVMLQRLGLFRVRAEFRMVVGE